MEGVVAHVAYGLDEHTTGTAGRVIDGLAGLRVEDVNEQFDDRSGGVELTRLGLAVIGELLEHDLVGVAHEVVGVVAIAQFEFGHVLDEVADTLVGEDAFVGPFLRGEDRQHAVEGVGVRQFDLPHSADEG